MTISRKVDGPLIARLILDSSGGMYGTMRNILQTDRRRRLELIELLYESNEEWITLKKLSTTLACSERVLKKDIAVLKDSIAEPFLQTSVNGVRLLFSSNIGIEKIYQAALKDTSAFQLLEALMYDESKSLDEMAESLFISPSTLYRTIKKLNRSLSSFDLQVKMNPCRLAGSERNIRYFYSLYFLERYSYLEWPFETIDLAVFEQFLLLAASIAKVTLNFPDFVKLKYWTAIAMIRIRNNHYTEIKTSSFSQLIPDLSSYRAFLKPFEQAFDIPLNKETLEQLFRVFLKKEYAFSYSSLFQKTQKDPLVKRSLTFLSKSLDELSEKSGIPLKNKEHLLLDIHNISYMVGQKRLGTNFILYDQKSFFIQMMKKQYSDFMRLIDSILSEYEAEIETEVNEAFHNELLYTLIIHWEGLVFELFKNKKVPKILIVSSFDLEHAKLLQDLVEVSFKDEISVDYWKEPQLSAEQLEESDYDIVITNFSIENIRKKTVIWINNVPTKKDWEDIRSAVEYEKSRLS